MANRDDIKKELEEEQDEFYGDEAPGGHMQSTESDDDAEEALASFIGNKPPKKLNIKKDIEGDEENIAGWSKNSEVNFKPEKDPDKRLERVEEEEKIDYLEDKDSNPE